MDKAAVATSTQANAPSAVIPTPTNCRILEISMAGEAAWSDPVGEQLARLVRLPRLPEIPDPSLDYSPGADLLGPPAAVGETQFECVVQ